MMDNAQNCDSYTKTNLAVKYGFFGEHMKDDNSSDASSAMCGVLCFAGQGKTQ
jgi:hypothetical protein